MKSGRPRTTRWTAAIRRRGPWLPLAVAVGGVAAIIAVASVLAFGWRDGSIPTSSPVEATAASLATGERLFAANCVVCHGADAKGSILAPDLTVHVPTRNDGFIFSRITNGFPDDSKIKTMPSFSELLTETERWHLVNFLRDSYGEIQPVFPEETSQ